MERKLTASQKAFLGARRQKIFQASPRQLQQMVEEELEEQEARRLEEDDCDWNSDGN